MTAFSLRGVSCLAVAASLMGGLTACTAAPRYPVSVGEPSGGGFEPLQPHYPVRLATAAEQAPQPAPTPALEPDAAPRAAPAGEVIQETLGPVDSAPPFGGDLLLQADPLNPSNVRPPRPGAPTSDVREAPSPPPAPPAEQARSSSAPEPASPPVASSPTRSPAAITPSSERIGSSGSTTPARPGGSALAAFAATRAPFLQSGLGAGPPRFTIGTPLAAAPVAQSALQPTTPTPYARPSAPAPTYVQPTYASPSYARPGGPAPGLAPSPYARPTVPYAVAPGVASSGGPRPYTSLFPQGSRGPIRSAGIRSTPGNPGIAPQPLTLPPLVDASPPSASEVASVGQGRFSWPLRGSLISAYGDKGGGQRNDGLNIAASVGDAVRASAAGEVVYAGDLVPGSGNLVLVKHPGGWVTAYAHLSRIEVKMRDPIAQGQEIGQAGQTGGVDRPQLHFEIRYARNPQLKATPVDPATLLPRG